MLRHTKHLFIEENSCLVLRLFSVVLVTAVCGLFLFKLHWPSTRRIYDLVLIFHQPTLTFVCIPCGWKTFLRDADIKTGDCRQIIMLNPFEKNWYVFVCFVSIDTVYLKIYSPQLIQEMLLGRFPVKI